MKGSSNVLKNICSPTNLMIDKTFLSQIAIKNQTTLRNILREYYQHLFLSYFYQMKQSEHFFFKGGTALKIAFRSPRFSEDLDFNATTNFSTFETIEQDVLIAIKKDGIDSNITESKKTSGGFFAIISSRMYDEQVIIKIQASKRVKKPIQGEKIIVISDFFPAYPLQILARELLFTEKIAAFLRRAKSRDYFDLYYILRSGIKLKILADKAKEIKSVIEKETGRFAELKELLPQNFWSILKDLKNNILLELQKQHF